MPDIETLRSLLARVEKAEGPSNELDARIRCALFAPSDAHVEKSQINGRWCIYHGTDRSGKPRLFDKPRDAPNDIWISDISASIDAAVALINRALPGWYWRVASCHLSDDAWVAPDYNDPSHAERLAREFPPALPDWAEITDVDRRPAGQPALALIESLLRALIEMEEGRAV